MSSVFFVKPSSSIPDKVLAQLLDYCQEAAQSQFPSNYNAATSDEKMVLSLSVPKQIIDALTLVVFFYMIG
ncbi:MAG: hypothetical protein F6K14_16690 [Symploca sp. SIO2C1]|nr:hypothetical protein [Symploca sp. SIO2C1]